ncbi:MAG TPA: oxygenase MpaB family protein [Caulobacteraceae bacterium]|jgi:uncharacterized protein (DUF2236 family)
MTEAPRLPAAADLLPAFAARQIGALAEAVFPQEGGPVFDFTRPRGEAALTAPDSVHWRVFKNPVSLYIGGVAAVILELAEPRVRTGVWEHSGFRQTPVRRLQSTGLAAMISVYGPRSAAEAMIAGVVERHRTVRGVTPAGEPYAASDPDLLLWVQATTGLGFGDAYSRYVRPLTADDLDRLYAESEPSALLYGVKDPPRTRAEIEAVLSRMAHRLAPSAILDEFLQIMRTAPAMPRALRPLQAMFVRAAVDMTPDWARERLALDPTLGLRPGEEVLIRQLGVAADRIPLPSSPAVRACVRLGLPADWLYRR